jgi:Skp family chaperone for outer membrane proteins
MSKMSSSKCALRLGGSRPLRVTAALAFALLAGCGPNVHSSSIRGIGYVRVEDVVKHHPLYPQLSQLDDAIAAINLNAAMPHVPLSASQIAAQTKELNAEMQAANERAGKIIAQKQQTYLKREAQAIGAALQAANVPGAGQYAAQLMSAASGQQAQQAAQAAGQDFLAYQKSVIEQNRAAAAAIVRQLQLQAQQKYRAKAEQLAQQETDLSMSLSQQDAQQRLAIKTRLSNLALDEATRKQLQAQVAAIDAKEAAQINAMRKADQATLNAYQKQLNDESNAQMRTQLSAIQSQTQSKIEERRNEVGNQIRSLGPPSLPQNLPSDVKEKIAQIHNQLTAEYQADAGQTIAEYNATKNDLDRQFAALHGADVGATGAAAKELDALQKRRNDLYQEIVDQIQREASRIAKDQGFSIVFNAPDAAVGGYDMTNEVTKDVESLHE